MGTIATFFRRPDYMPMVDVFSATKDTTETRAKYQARTLEAADPYKLRALPNDDVYFFVKRIDNSRVVRQADPMAKGQCMSAIGATCVLAVLAGSVMAPKLGSVLAGYKIQQLKQEQASLHEEKRALEVEEATLTSPSRLHQLAEKHDLGRPMAGQEIHLQPSGDGAFASLKTR